MTVLADIGIGPISIPTPGDVVTALKNAVIDVAGAVFDKIIEWIAGLLAQAVAKVTEALVTLLSSIKATLTPGGGIADAAPIQQSIVGMAAMLVTIFFVFRIIHGIITGQAGQNLRATIIDLPMVIVGTLFFGFLCYTLLQVVDAFSDPLIGDYATTLTDTVTKLYSQDGIVQGGVFVIIFALLYIIAAVFLCFELFVRSSLIYLVVMFAPLAIATRIWGPTRSYARRATETAVALIFSKLAIAVTLATGASLMAGAAEDGGNVAMIQGSAILLLAAFMPFGLMRVIPMMEGAIAGEGVARTMGAKAAVGGIAAAGGVQLAGKGISNAIGSKTQMSGTGGSTSNTNGSGSGGGSGGDGGPTPPAGPTQPGGSGGGPSSSGPILRPSAPSSKAQATASSPGNVADTSQSSGAPSGEPTPSTTPSASTSTPVSSTPKPASGKPPASTATAHAQPDTAPQTEKVIKTLPLKNRSGGPTSTAGTSAATASTAGTSATPASSAAPSKLPRQPTATAPPAPVPADTAPAVPSVPLARSRTIERPKPRTPKPSTESETP